MGKGYDFDELFPGRFLKSGQFKGKDVTLKITKVELEKLPDQKQGEKVKGILSFAEVKLQLVLNRTNALCLRAMFGRDTGEWVGKRVTFFPAIISAFGDDNTLAIRVRGSPDLERDMPIEIQLPNKRPVKATMKKTGRPAQKAAPAPQPAPPPEPSPAPPEELSPDQIDTAEPPDDVVLPTLD
jgi:hypothetical protein